MFPFFRAKWENVQPHTQSTIQQIIQLVTKSSKAPHLVWCTVQEHWFSRTRFYEYERVILISWSISCIWKTTQGKPRASSADDLEECEFVSSWKSEIRPWQLRGQGQGRRQALRAANRALYCQIQPYLLQYPISYPPQQVLFGKHCVHLKLWFWVFIF